MQLIKPILEEAAAIASLRRDLHAHPELGYQEERTAALIADTLSGWGITVQRGLGGTGVVGTIRNGSGLRAIGLRADFDALPVTERNSFAHASVHAHGELMCSSRWISVRLQRLSGAMTSIRRQFPAAFLERSFFFIKRPRLLYSPTP